MSGEDEMNARPTNGGLPKSDPTNGAATNGGPTNGAPMPGRPIGPADDDPAGLDDLRDLALAVAPELAGHPIVALGWATVDLDAVRERIENDAGFGAFVRAARDEHLGGRAVIHRPDADSGEPIEVLLEPDTEGRLAASLARHGEGFAAIWFGPRPGAERDRPDGFGGPAHGPLGVARLLLGGPPWGLSVLLLESED
jgi:hypothetical protein